MESPESYIPIDRRFAIAHNAPLAERSHGAALFADISGFTPLTDALVRSLGPQRGAEELPRQLNRVYDAVIAEVDRYGGSVVGFSGDAITCWFDSDNGLRAAASALAIQHTMHQFVAVPIPDGTTVALTIKVAVAAGSVRRFVVGDPETQRIDVLAGATLERLTAAEHHANKGEVVLDPHAGANLAGHVAVVEWRADEPRGQRFAVVDRLTTEVAPKPWPALNPNALSETQIRPWLLPPVHERLRSGLGEFLTELRPAVALFVRFTGIDYDCDEQACEKLDIYIRWVQSILVQYGGFLIQLTVGDKGSYLYAAFGAPIAHDDDATRAVAAALGLRLPPQELSFIQDVQIGISRGRMRTGAYGGLSARTYGVLGPETNMAARLMQHAPAGQVLVSRAAQKETGDAFTWEELPPLRVKGKAEPAIVFRLVAANEHHTMRLQEPRYALPMVGREAELTVIKQKLAQALQGHGQIIAITAEAGMGKSRLVAEIVRLVQNRQIVGYGGECQSYGTNNSYLVWEPIWRQFFGLDPAATPDEQVQVLERQLRTSNPSLVPRLPLLSTALNLPIPDNDLTRALDAKLRKASLEALLVECLRARAKDQPLMLVLEDCHWLDPLSHDLLEAIGRAISDLPVLIVIAYRPPELERLQAPRVGQLRYCTIVPLKDFTREEAARLIRLKLAQLGADGTEPPAALVERITARAQGNPFYIEELLNYLRDQGIDPHDSQALAQLDLPTSLHSLILSRIDQLTESQKLTIKVASIIGRSFQFTWLWGVHPHLGEQPRIKADLDALRRLDLTPLDQPEPELTYLFKHIVTREVAYESLPFATREVLHDHLGQFIEHTYSDTLDQYIDLLAYHYDHSRNVPKRREYLSKAGEAAQAAYANDAALDYYRRVLPLLDESEQSEILLKLGQVLQLVGEWTDAHEMYHRALDLTAHMNDARGQALCRRLLGELLRKRGEYAAALQWLEQSRTGFMKLGDLAGVSQVYEAIGEVHRLKGEYDQAMINYEVSLELAKTLAPPDPGKALRARALKGAGALAIHHGEYPAAHRYYEESLVLLRELNDKPNIASVLSNLGIVVQHEGDYAHARELGEEGLAIRRELGDRWGIAASLGNLGMVAGLERDYGRAAALYEECLGLYRQLGEKNFAALTLNNLGDVIREQGDYATARALYEEGLLIQREVGDQWAIAYLLEAFAALAAAQAQAERALRLAGYAAALRQTIGAPLAPAEQTQLDQALAAARKALGEIRAADYWAEGAAMTLAQAIEYALQAPYDSRTIAAGAE